MYVAITNQIQVTAIPDFMPDRSDPEQGRFSGLIRLRSSILGLNGFNSYRVIGSSLMLMGGEKKFGDLALSANNLCSNPERFFVMLQAVPSVRPQA